MTFLSYLDTYLGFSVEKIPEKGEDSWCYSFNERAGLLGVFDGCGGLGAATYQKLGGKSGAYLASRAASGAAMEWFDQGCMQPGFDAEGLKQQLMDFLRVCVREADTVESKFRGSMVRLMPTTAALWVVETEQGRLKATSISAGDSRNYILTGNGLFQISVDDLSGEDAMSNLYNDGAMTNVVSADGRFTLAQAAYSMDVRHHPCILLSATDGCFGYLRSPMEFELLLLETLRSAENVDQWQQNLMAEIGAVAGDDQSLAMAVFGFGTFEKLKQAMEPRRRQLAALVETFGDDVEKRWCAWEEYKTAYYRLAEGGVPSRG